MLCRMRETDGCCVCISRQKARDKASRAHGQLLAELPRAWLVVAVASHSVRTLLFIGRHRVSLGRRPRSFALYKQCRTDTQGYRASMVRSTSTNPDWGLSTPACAW